MCLNSENGMGPFERKLIHAVRRRHGDHMGRAKVLQDPRHLGSRFAVKSAHDLAAHTSRVAQRPQDVEARAHGQLPARRHDVLHGRVVMPREDESNAHLVQTGGYSVGTEVNMYAQFLQDVRGPALGRHAHIAMLGYGYPRTGAHEAGRRRNIECPQSVATGATEIDGLCIFTSDGHQELAHHLGKGGKLF